MWWLIGIGGIFALLTYITMFLVFGWRTISNGHGLLFVLGFFLPVLWIVGVLKRPNPEYA